VLRKPVRTATDPLQGRIVEPGRGPVPLLVYMHVRVHTESHERIPSCRRGDLP
jgi:hypothetical protein